MSKKSYLSIIFFNSFLSVRNSIFCFVQNFCNDIQKFLEHKRENRFFFKLGCQILFGLEKIYYKSKNTEGVQKKRARCCCNSLS